MPRHLPCSCRSRHFDTLAALTVALVVASCGSSDDPPAPDGRGPALEAGVKDGSVVKDSGVSVVKDGGGGTAFDDVVARACQRIVADCQGQSNPLGQQWTASIVPWTEEACRKTARCLADQTATKCFDRLVTYYMCVVEIDPFSCQGCLNQYQFIMGACPCLKSCDPGCP